MINGYAKCGRVNEANELFNSMRQKDSVSLLELYDFGSRSKWPNKRRLDAFSKMLIDRSVGVDESILVGVLYAISDLGLLEMGRWAADFIFLRASFNWTWSSWNCSH